MRKLRKDESMLFKILLEEVIEKATSILDSYLSELLQAVAVDVARTIKEEVGKLDEGFVKDFVDAKKAGSRDKSLATRLRNEAAALKDRVKELEKELSVYRGISGDLRELLRDELLKERNDDI